jgi:hypothetical protein
VFGRRIPYRFSHQHNDIHAGHSFFGSNTKGSLDGIEGITPWPGGVVDPQNPSYTPAKGFSISGKVIYHQLPVPQGAPPGHSLETAPMFYAQDRDMFTNEIGLGEFPDGNFFDAVWPGRHPYG